MPPSATATIGAFEKGMQWQRSLGLFNEISKDGFPADVITHSATIGACRQIRQWQRPVGSFEEMQSHRFQAVVMTYGATISACAVASRLRVFEEMSKQGAQASVKAPPSAPVRKVSGGVAP